MAQDTIGNLFGPTPWQIQQQQYLDDEARAARMATMPAVQRGVQGMMQGGAGLARLGAQAMGLQNPAVEAARQQQEAMKGVNFQNPETMRLRANEIRATNPMIAARLEQMANQLENDISQRGLESAQAKKAGMPNWDIKTIKVGEDLVQDVQWDKTGQYADIMLGKPYKKDGDGAGGRGGSVRYEAVINPETLEERVVPVGQLNQYLEKGWQQMKYSSGVAGRVSAAKKGGAEESEVATGLDKRVDAGNRALPKIDETIRMLESGSLNVGPGSEIKQGFDRAKMFFLDSKKSGKYTSDTEILNAMLGSDVFGFIQSLGIGARGMDTPAERQFLMQVMTGDISLTKETLLALARRRKAEINRDKAELDRMKASGEYRRRTGNREGIKSATTDELRAKYNLGK